MDSAAAGLLFALVGACGVWWLTRSLVHRYSTSSERSVAAVCALEEAVTPKKLFRTLLYLRLAGIALCVAAAGVLFWAMGTGLAACLAGAGCLLQFAAYRVRVSQQSCRTFHSVGSPPRSGVSQS